MDVERRKQPRIGTHDNRESSIHPELIAIAFLVGLAWLNSLGLLY